MSDIVELGHTGLRVRDLAKCRDFYANVVGLHVTDHDEGMGLVFLSSRPDVEHHELVLQAGRTDAGEGTVQQISWRVESVEALQRFRQRFDDHHVTIEGSITHGNAIGLYFFDPEGNRNEVYLRTGLEVRQPFARKIDISGDGATVLATSARLVEERRGPTSTQGAAR